MWSALDVLLRHGVQFLALIALARLLTPEDYGVIAMLAIFVGVASIFIDSGFSSALIQRQNITRTDESTVFFFNLTMGLTTALLLCLSAPLIATFFRQPIIEFVTYAMAGNLLVSAFGSIHTTLLMKAMNFKTIAKVGGISSAISGLLAIMLAYHGFGVWSLVAQTITASVISVLLLWHWHPWRPAWEFSVPSLRSCFRFGGFVFLSAFLDVAYSRLNLLLIGKLYTTGELGFYDRALAIRQMPSYVLEAVFNRVAFPLLSRATMDRGNLVKTIRKILIVMMFINVPVMLGIAVVAEPLVFVLFGDRWLPAVPILKVLCLAGVLWPLHTVNLNALLAQGRSDLFFRIEVVKKAVGVSVTLIACQYGVMAIAWALVLTGIIAFFINAHYTAVLLGYGAKAQMLDLLPFVSPAVLVATGGWFLEMGLLWPPLYKLILIVALGSVLYLSSGYFLLRRSDLGQGLIQALKRQGTERMNS